jgi:hypothetical protein
VTKDQPNNAVTELSSDVVELSKGLAPARSGWILAVVLIVTIIEVTNYFEAHQRSTNMVAYFENLESNRSNENRRLSEALKGCGETLGRIAERGQRQQAELEQNEI